MPKLNAQGQAMFQRLSEAEAAGKKLNPEGQRLLSRLREAQAVESPIQDAPQAAPTLRDNVIEKGPEIGQMVGSSFGLTGTAIGRTIGEIAKRNPELAKKVIDASNWPSEKIKEGYKLIGLPDMAADMVGDAFSPSGIAMQEVGGPLAAKAVGPGVERLLAKGAGVLGKVQSGVERLAGERLFKDPGALVEGASKGRIGKALGAFRKEQGLDYQPTVDEIIDTEGASAYKFARKILKRMESGKDVAKNELLRAKQSISDLIEKTPFQQENRRRLLIGLKNKVSEKLGELVPREAEMSGRYARASLGDEFMKVLPVTKSGDVSSSRILFSSLAGAKAPLAVMAQSPMLAGAEIATAGAAFKAAKSILENPSMRRAIMILLANQGGTNENAEGQR